MTPATISNSRLDRAIRIMNILAVVGMAITVGAIFLFAPVEVLMGNVQRLFYFHVGAAWVGAMVFGVALVCGALYLWRGRRIFDTVSLASVEVGPVSYTHLRAHETVLDLVCRLLLEKKKADRNYVLTCCFQACTCRHQY